MNDGLLAILDGCPQLESLDLRKCFHVTLSGYLGKYAERIKVLRHPNDSTDNYEFVADDGSFEEVSYIVYSLDDIHDDGSLMMMMDLLLMMMMTRTTIPPTPTNDFGDFYFDQSFCIVYLNKMTFVLYLF